MIIRTLISEKEIRYPTSRGKVIVKKGPTGFITTTTKINVNDENETRYLSLDTNDSRKQTEKNPTCYWRSPSGKEEDGYNRPTKVDSLPNMAGI